MESSIKNLKPDKVFQYFSDICKIPHGSGNLDGIVNYLVDFAKSHNLKYIVDDEKNVVIYKDAKDNTHTEPIILQAHIDMVCVHSQNVDIDMTKTPLDIYVDDNKLRARDTSLGADDGIGVAIILSLLDENEYSFPPIEALFTSDEETGMNGAIGIEGKLFKSKRLINIDSEDEGELTVSCAGGSHCESEIPVVRVSDKNVVSDITSKYSLYSIKVSGLLGGHSGMEIHKGRANAIIELAYILGRLQDENIDFYLVSIGGGKFENVICPECKCLVYVKGDKNVLNDLIHNINEELKIDYKLTDKNIEVSLSVEDKSSVEDFGPITKESSTSLINAVLSLPQGLVEVSQEFINLPWTSLNLGKIETKLDKVILITLIRSNIDIKKQKLIKKYKTIIENAGGILNVTSEYPAWQYNKESKLMNDMLETYKSLFGKDMKVVATHGGLECGLFMEKIKGLEAVSIGPTLTGVHSIDETLYIDTVKKVYDFLINYLTK